MQYAGNRSKSSIPIRGFAVTPDPIRGPRFGILMSAVQTPDLSSKTFAGLSGFSQFVTAVDSPSRGYDFFSRAFRYTLWDYGYNKFLYN
jgi:hypothetical protein